MKKNGLNLFLATALTLVMSFVVVASERVEAASKKLNATGQVQIKKKLPTANPDDATPLSTSDCKLLLNGTVIEVADNRCGASGKYCKSSAGSACITE